MADNNGSSKREIYLKHLEYLEEELERHQHKRDKLKKNSEDLTLRYGTLEKRNRDLSKKLLLSWAEKEEKEDELKEQLKSQKQAWEQEREALELQHRQRVQKLKEQIDELNSVIAAKSEELKVSAAKSEEHKKQVMDQLPHIKSLETQNKELDAAIMMERELQGELRKWVSKEEVKERAERNASIILQKERAEDRDQRKEIQLLLTENVLRRKEIDALQTKLNDLRKMEEMEIENSKKQALEDAKLVQRIKQLEVELRDLNITTKQVVAREEDVRRDLALVSKECCQKTAKARQLEAAIQKERKRNRQLEKVMWEADIVIKDILTDPGDSEEMPTIEWKMERVLDILESTAPIETGSNRSSQAHKLQTKTLKQARKL